MRLSKARMIGWAFLLWFGIWLISACAGATTPTPAPTSATDVPATQAPAGATPTAAQAGPDAAALLEARCTTCHSLRQVQTAKKTAAQWETTVRDMRNRGARLTDAEAQVLVRYLAETYR